MLESVVAGTAAISAAALCSRPQPRHDPHGLPHKAREATAYHEAGHAVIGRVLTLPCGHATALPDHDSPGHSICADPFETLSAWELAGKFREPASALLGRVMAFMAGREAEEEILGTYGTG
jgi:ATP-dependent Zn protease